MRGKTYEAEHTYAKASFLPNSNCVERTGVEDLLRDLREGLLERLADLREDLDAAQPGRRVAVPVRGRKTASVDFLKRCYTKDTSE